MEGCNHVRNRESPGIKTELLDRLFNTKYLIKYSLVLHLCDTSVSPKTNTCTKLSVCKKLSYLQSHNSQMMTNLQSLSDLSLLSLVVLAIAARL